MDVRNLQEYITHLCGTETLNLLGTNEEVLLRHIYGQDYSDDQVKALVAEVASFASKAEEQLFYEFVQNAYDAKADSLFFFANERYLIVLNNGEPFYTDFDLTTSKRNGQLYSFLAKGKSDKRNDESQMGQFGQGSKLLYTLLAREGDYAVNKDLMVESIYDQHKGPYLISWYNQTQLANLLLKQPDWHLSRGDDYENNILFAKILMTYYPIAPGTDPKWFSDEEALDAVEAFDTLVNPRRNIQFLKQGTAIVIPLGEGKYERICARENLDNVRSRLSGFASITRDLQRNAGKRLEHIYVMGEEIEQHEVRSTFVTYTVDGNDFKYHFAFNPAFAANDVVNLFKGLPITETKLRLGMIIDSPTFECDNSRQRFLDPKKTQRQLTRAFEALVEVLRDTKETDKEKFDYIYQSLLASTPQTDSDSAYVWTPFEEVFTPFFKEFARTSDGDYLEADQVKHFEGAALIPLEEIGITAFRWVDDDSYTALQKHGVEVEEVDLTYVLEHADQERLRTWLTGLATPAYDRFIAFVDSKKDERSVAEYPLFRSNKGKLYSYKELQSTAHVYYPYEAGMKFGECEHIGTVLTGLTLHSYIGQLYDKIKTNIVAFRSTPSTTEDAANLLRWIIDHNNNRLADIKKVRKEIALLPNLHNEYVPFKDLFAERPEGTILLDNYVVKGAIPPAIASCGMLLSPATQKKDCWLWVISHWEELKAKEEWGTNTRAYLRDLVRLYKDAYAELGYLEKQKVLPLYLDSNGLPTNEQRSIVENADKLTEEEYNMLEEKVPSLRLQPYEYQATLSVLPFLKVPIRSTDIVKPSLQADAELLKIIVKISPDYLGQFQTAEYQGSYVIVANSNPYKNYTESVLPELKQELATIGLYHLPELVQSLVDASGCSFISNGDLLMFAIKLCKRPILLLPLVKRSNDNVISGFFNRLGDIDINTKLSATDLEWQLIDFAMTYTGGNYTGRLLELIRHNGYRLPDSITSQDVWVEQKRYDLYELDDSYEKQNETIDSFTRCLPSSRDVDQFKKSFYGDRENNVTAESLYEALKDTYLTVEQLQFCLHYSIANNADYDNLEIKEGERLEDALQMVLDNNFVGFDKYFRIADADLDTQVYAPLELLTEAEKLPKALQQWIDEHPGILPLFSRLGTKSRSDIVIRKSLLDDAAYKGSLNLKERAIADHLDDLFEWAIDKGLTYLYKSNRYATMMQLVESLPSSFNGSPFLRYTGEVAPTNEGKDTRHATFTLERYQAESAFLSPKEYGSLLERRLQSDKVLAGFISDHVVYACDSKSVPNRYTDSSVWTIQTAVSDTVEHQEYHDDVYDQWKSTPESKGITIQVTDKDISMSFCIRDANGSVFEDQSTNTEFGTVRNKAVIVKHPNDEGLSVLKCVAKHIAEADFFKEPFIALQALYVDQWEQGSGKSSLTRGTITEDTAKNLDKINNLTKEFNDDELTKLIDMNNPIKELINFLNKEKLERLAQNKEKIVQLLDEEKEAKVNKIIGYLGERLYMGYLYAKEKEYDYAAMRGVGAYDFELKNDHVFVDVKTSVGSLKDGNTPFYLHKSQDEFMKSHPDAEFHIVRISLSDLDPIENRYKKLYEHVCKHYGADADPMTDEYVSDCCKAIAQSYWEEDHSTKEFEERTSEYAIRTIAERVR